jgi:uncharacterized radical SAM superfamily Fe-S cluster-containing enzyme
MVRRNRPYIYHNFTNSLCPTCLKVIQAKVILQDNRVYMLKTCPDHGAMRTLLSSDAAYYLSQSQYNKPGTLPRHFQMPVEKGCPLDCGLCTDHEQHTCLAIVEVTEACPVLLVQHAAPPALHAQNAHTGARPACRPVHGRHRLGG